LEWQLVEMDALPAEDIRHYMTHEPVTADPDGPIRTLARKMIAASVHRVVVIDSAGGPVGIVSSTDLVAALAGADESALGHDEGDMAIDSASLSQEYR
jgi:CBS domain-containing protein